MSDESPLRKLAANLRQAADEIRLKIHLGGMEAKDQWEKLEPKVASFEKDVNSASVEMADGVTEKINQAGTALKSQLEKLRDKLRSK
jgi:hypothetical protein